MSLLGGTPFKYFNSFLCMIGLILIELWYMNEIKDITSDMNIVDYKNACTYWTGPLNLCFFPQKTISDTNLHGLHLVSRDMPIRYFDGKEWKFMKPRHNIRTRAPRYTNISTESDWADLIKEIKEIDLQEPATQMAPTCRSKTMTTEKTTTKRTITTKKTTPKKITFKMTTPKITKRKTRPFIQPTTTTKAAIKHSTPRCKLKLKTTTTMLNDPQFWQTKPPENEDWINAWTRLRPTKEIRPTGQDVLVDTSQCKYKSETAPITSTTNPVFWEHQMITNEDWINIWTRVRPTKKPSTITMKKYTTRIVPTTSTKKHATTNTVPVTKTRGPVRTTEKPVKMSGTQVDDRNAPEYWSNLMKEFLKYVEYKKCQPPCEYSATTTTPFKGYMFGGKRFRSGGDELANILLDDVEIDDRLTKVDDGASQDTAIMRYQDTYEADREQRLNFESVENFVSSDSKINNENEQYLDLLSFNDSVEAKRIKEDDETAFKSNYITQDYETPRVGQSEANYDELKVKNAIEEDEVLQDSEINSYINVLKEKHTKKEKYSETTAYNLDAENAGHTGKSQDEDIRKRLDAIKDTYTQRYKDSSHYLSKDPLDFKELNRIADYVATKRAHSTVSIEMRNDNDDFLQDEDMTFDLGTLEADHEKVNKYTTESIELRDLEVYAYGDALQDVNV